MGPTQKRSNPSPQAVKSSPASTSGYSRMKIRRSLINSVVLIWVGMMYVQIILPIPEPDPGVGPTGPTIGMGTVKIANAIRSASEMAFAFFSAVTPFIPEDLNADERKGNAGGAMRRTTPVPDPTPACVVFKIPRERAALTPLAKAKASRGAIGPSIWFAAKLASIAGINTPKGATNGS